MCLRKQLCEACVSLARWTYFRRELAAGGVLNRETASFSPPTPGKRRDRGYRVLGRYRTGSGLYGTIYFPQQNPIALEPIRINGSHLGAITAK